MTEIKNFFSENINHILSLSLKLGIHLTFLFLSLTIFSSPLRMFSVLLRQLHTISAVYAK